MAYSIQREVSDGTLVLLDVSISYIERSEISVYFDDVLQTEGATWAWVGVSDAKISFSPAVDNGVEVAVVRQTDLSALRHRFSEGAAFTANSMDEALEQVLHIAQESAEQLQGTDFYNDLDMHGYRVKNVGGGVAPGDAANVGQMVVHDATIVGYRDQTLIYRNDAEGFADVAEASAILVSTAADVAVDAHVALPDPHSQYVLTAEVQKSAWVSSSAGGTADAITAAYTPAIVTLTEGMTLFVRAGSANATATPTFTPNSGTIAAKPIVKGNNLPLAAGDIAGAGHWLEMNFDTTLDKWVLQNPYTTGLQAASSAETQAGILTTKAVTPKGLADTMLGGVGQTWQNVTGSRAAGTTYYNTTSRPILVEVTTGGFASTSITATVNGVQMGTHYNANAGGGSSFSTFIVPVGGSYSVAIVSGGLGTWLELR